MSKRRSCRAAGRVWCFAGRSDAICVRGCVGAPDTGGRAARVTRSVCSLVVQTPRARVPPSPASFGPLSCRSVDVSISFLSLYACENKAYYFTSLPSADAVCEKETFPLMRTRGKSQHVSTINLYACADRIYP